MAEFKYVESMSAAETKKSLNDKELDVVKIDA